MVCFPVDIVKKLPLRAEGGDKMARRVGDRRNLRVVARETPVDAIPRIIRIQGSIHYVE
ncbi:hypothetical protein [Sphingopyxis sp. L1A2A]|uniref:hypothetical protein n=1 Tax=Sphingopyxis sp. L1A2A TaxID=2502247 RepID=UPI0014856B16|nr:hypothetical protein [Sphingopyxis sp. L1A2A]